jgi:hypothetical protein
MKQIFFFLLLFTSLNIASQSNINNYQFALVDENFDFLKKKDQYQTSSLTKFLLNKYGVKSFFSSDPLPEELLRNNCDAMYVSVKNNSGMFTTKVSIEFKDCLGKVIYKSKEGRSRKKEYKEAYHEAIRNAFLDDVIKNYSYKKNPNLVLKNKSIVNNQKRKELTPVPKLKTKKEKVPTVINNTGNSIQVLYAQQNSNGFQLVDTSPKIVFKMLKTSKNELYILVNKDGIVYPNGKNWTIEYYENNKLIKKNYQIKF